MKLKSYNTYLILTPIDFLKACVKASVLPISSENISLPAILVKGVSVPRACDIPGIQTLNSNNLVVIFISYLSY